MTSCSICTSVYNSQICYGSCRTHLLRCRSRLASFFQVKEARAYLFTSIFYLRCCYFTIVWLVWYYECMECLVMWLGLYVWLMRVRTAARTDNLAQASLSRLGRHSRNWPRLLLELSLKRRAFVLSDKASLSGERVSPKRELVVSCCGSLCCRAGERPHFERRAVSLRRGGLAQARTRKAYYVFCWQSHLSEVL